jgi:nitrate reductase alpha subunit
MSISIRTDHASVLERNIPAIKMKLKEGEAYVTTVYDLFIANYGVDRGFGGGNVASSFDDDVPTPLLGRRKLLA